MGKRIHGGILRAAETFFLRITVPSLPDRGGPILNFVTPGGIFSALNKLSRQIVLAARRQNREQWPRSEKARRHATFIPADFLRELLSRAETLVIRCQAGKQRQCISGLGI